MHDYVIVGAGTAGCVLAARLSEDKQNRVLLLEAGPRDTDPRIHLPAAFPKLFKTELDWNLETVPQRHANNRRLFWPRGKVVGGCSSTNAMIYMRGNRRDFDDWAANGCTGWSFAECLPYFKKSERNTRLSGEFHGTSGQLSVTDRGYTNPLSHAFVAACQQAGIPATTDFNGAEQDGVALAQVNQENGQRCSAARAFLKPALGRRNLRVETGAHATSLIFEGHRAIGVAYIQNGQNKTVRAEREVILCLGAVHSPQLLLLSGVGPAAHLASVGIDCRHELPGVGENLHDHPIIGPINLCTQKVTLDTAETVWNLAQYFLFHRGPLTSNVAEACAFVKSDPALDRPDLQFHFAPGFFYQHGLSDLKHIAFSFGPCLVQPKSRGTLRLRSNNPLDAPLADPNYLADDSDLRALLHGVKLARTIAAQTPFTPYRGDEFLPGKSVTSDDDLKNYIRNYFETLYHPVGSCKMGTDPLAVVDPQLRVHGLQGLRVADASVMPTIVGGNTNAAALLIGERAADFIRKEQDAVERENAFAPTSEQPR
jgi:choline dehydrogenase